REAVHVVHFLWWCVNPDVVIDPARIATAKPLALREARALAGNDIVDAAVRGVRTDDGHLASRPTAIFAGPAGVGQAPSEQIADGELCLDGFDIGHPRDRVGNFSADVDAVGESPGAARPGKCF